MSFIPENLESVPCDFCGSWNNRTLFHQRDVYINMFKTYDYAFPIVECRECGLIFVNPRPTKENIGFFYPDIYHDGRLPERMDHRYQCQKRYLPLLSKGSKILDLGCAKGDFLAWLATHEDYPLEMYGCDAYSGGVREGYPIQFTGLELPDCRYPDTYFDCVTAWAVLEHVHSPKAYFAEVARILKPGGKFVFVVPNFNSLMCRVAKQDDIARHIYQFTPDSVNKYLKRSGFSQWTIDFDDDIFDGRGTGSLTALLGFSRILRPIDAFIFRYHWEKLFKISGTLLVSALL